MDTDEEQKTASGWCWNSRIKKMELYQEGIAIQRHLCEKDFPHDIFECNRDYSTLKVGRGNYW